MSKPTSLPPVFVRGGKRLNFDRRDPWTDEINDWFYGSGKCEGNVPECSWEELCAMAALIVAHPAFVPPGDPPSDYPPMIEDEREGLSS